MPQCVTCGAWHWSTTTSHKCAPQWLVHVPDWHDDDREAEHATVYAHDAQEAAESWARRHDASGDYTIIGGSPQQVQVRAASGGEWQRFEVVGETVAEYHATEVG